MESVEKKARRLTITRSSLQTGDIPQYFVLGMGNPLLDMIVHVDADFLARWDLKMNNAILAEAKHAPMYDEIAKNHKVEYIAGGATQNAIRVCQWMLQSPGATAFIGSVGKDCQFGQKLREVATNDGVTTFYFEAPGQPTGTCAVAVHQKERSLVANLAAANAFEATHLQVPEVRDAVNKAHIVYSAGFFLTLPEGPKSALEVAKHASEANKIYCLNLAAPFICQFFSEPLLQLIQYADYVFGNESEAKALAQKMGWDENDLEGVAEKIASFPKQNGRRGRIAVITQGRDPTIVYADGHITLYPVTALSPHLIVDVNGAGDAFVGGFLSRLALTEAKNLHRDLDACVRAAQYAARVVIQNSGCAFPPHPDHV